jgi:phage/plasmid-like protein (TIGR03299 family)
MSYQLPALPQPENTDIAEKSNETMEWLRGGNILVGYVDERGPAWWANGAVTKYGTWEGLPEGTHFPQEVPVELAVKLLDVPLVRGEVESVKYKGEDGRVKRVRAPQFVPVINARTGEVFSMPSKSYAIHPYLQTLHGYIESIQYDEHVAVSSAGLLRKGAVAFLQARLPETFEVAGYGYQPYIMGVTSADRSRATWHGTGALGAVCDNTVDGAVLGAATSIKTRHTRNSLPQVLAARDALGLHLAAKAEEIGEMIEQLANVTVTDADFEKWLDLEVEIPEKDASKPDGGLKFVNAVEHRERLTDRWSNDPKVAPWKGTAFGGLQLVNTDRTWTGNSRIKRNFHDAAFGTGAKADIASLKRLNSVLEGKLVLA